MKNSFSYSGATLWNNLPCKIREFGSLNQSEVEVNMCNQVYQERRNTSRPSQIVLNSMFIIVGYKTFIFPYMSLWNNEKPSNYFRLLTNTVKLFRYSKQSIININ